MKSWRTLTATLLGIAGTGLIAAILVGHYSWTRTTSQLLRRLTEPSRLASSGPDGTNSIDDGDNKLESPRIGAIEPTASAEYSELPEPVRRYFRFAFPEARPNIEYARLTQSGRFRLGQSDKDWKPFTARQTFAISPPGFVWDARIAFAPGLSVRVRDAYVDGHGSMQAKMGSLITVMNERNRPELSSGALQRYLAETAWFPLRYCLKTESVGEGSVRTMRSRRSTTRG